MTLHHTLRQLIDDRGSEVLGDAAEFRGALDDYLTEEEAAPGEVNLLVDAVRLGAWDRLRRLNEQGADPRQGIAATADTLATDRGTDDPGRSRWALAVLAFASRLVDDSVVAAYPRGGRRPEATGAIPPPPSSSAPTLVGPATPPPVPSPPYPPFGAGPFGHAQPGPPPAPPGAARRRWAPILAMVAVAVLLVGAAAYAAVRLSGTGGEPAAGTDRASSSTTGDSTGDSTAAAPAGGIPSDALVLGIRDGSNQRIYQVDPASGAATAITPGPTDGLPNLSPDRSTLAYVTDAGDGARTVRLRDLATGEDTAPFDESSPCRYASRPTFSPDGTRLALVCTDEQRRPKGLYLSTLDGELTQVVADPLAGGTPTWVGDGDYLLYQRASAELTEERSIWRVDASAGATPEPYLAASGGLSVTHPDWDPGTGRILYLRSPAPKIPGFEYGELWVTTPGGRPTQVPLGRAIGHPVWSPDGRSVVAMVRDEAGLEQVVTFPIDDPSAPRQLTVSVAGILGPPVWGSR